MANMNEIIPIHFNRATYITETQMLNSIHNNHLFLCNTMMVGKQWVKSWSMYRWTGEACTYSRWEKQATMKVWGREQSWHCRKQYVAKAKNNVYPHKSWSKRTTQGPWWIISGICIAVGIYDVEQHCWFQAPFKTHQQKTCFFLEHCYW